jgi:DNA-binding response OmpR family regulator
MTIRQLLRVISNEARELSSPELIECGDFRIDLGSRTAFLRGERLELTAEEFDALVFVATHPQRFVSPHTMLATNWSTNACRQTEFLTVLINLRKKLDAAGAGMHYLRTEPWVIYRFDPTCSQKVPST